MPTRRGSLQRANHRWWHRDEGRGWPDPSNVLEVYGPDGVLLNDDFSTDTGLFTGSNPANPVISGGVLTATPTTSYYSKDTSPTAYNLTGKAVEWYNVANMFNGSVSSAAFWLRVSPKTSDAERLQWDWYVSGGVVQLRAGRVNAANSTVAVATLVYDPVKHKDLRIRHDRAKQTIYWEYRGTTGSWITAGSVLQAVSWPYDLANVFVNIGSGLSSGTASSNPTVDGVYVGPASATTYDAVFPLDSGASPWGFDTYNGTAGAITLDTANQLYGTGCVDVNANAGGARLRMNAGSLPDDRPVYGRFYLNLVTVPTVSTSFIVKRAATGGSANLLQIAVSTTPTISIRDHTGTVQGGTYTLSTGQWYRVEFMHDPVFSRMRMKVWASPSSAGAPDFDSGDQITIGNPDLLSFGQDSNTAVAQHKFDEIAISDQGWIGPFVPSGTPATASGSITLGGTVGAAAQTTASGSLTLGGSVSAGASAGASGSLSLGGSVSASAPATASGGLSLGGSVSAAGAATATGSLSLGGSVSAAGRATASGSIALGGSVTASAPATASGSLTLGGSATAAAPATASGSITLGGSATANGPSSTASGSLTLGGAVTAGASASASGSLTLGGSANWVVAGTTGSLTLGGSVTATAPATASGSLVLGGSVTARAAATASGALTLAGTVTAGGTASATGLLSLGGSVAAAGASGASGSLVLGGSVTAGASATASGSLTLGGSATVSGVNTAAGSITLGGSVTARAAATASGSISLGGSAAATAPATASGSLSLSGSALAAGKVTAASGSISLSGSALGKAEAVAVGSLTLSGSGTAGTPPNTASGSIALSGSASAKAEIHAVVAALSLGGSVLTNAITTMYVWDPVLGAWVGYPAMRWDGSAWVYADIRRYDHHLAAWIPA